MRKRGLRKSQSNLIWITIIGLVVLSFAALATWYVIASADKPNVDKETGCDLDGISNHTVVLVDKTDQLDASQITALRTLIGDVVENSVTGEKISLFELGMTDPFLVGPYFSRCLPRTGANASEWTENPMLLRATFNKRFVEPLEEGLRRVSDQSTGEASQTAIIESLMELINVGEFDYSVTDRKLVIVSDMLQHSELFSLYTSNPQSLSQNVDWDTVLVRSPDLSGVNVYIYWVLRSMDKGGARQTNELINFWTSYFERVGATVQSVRKIN